MPTISQEARGPAPRTGPRARARPSPRVVREPDAGGGRGPWLLCRACGGRVAAEGDRIPVGGGHRHRRVNPHGVAFEFGCFGSAAGAVAVGRATDEHTWFAGYAWSVARCGSCTAHLGWFFEGGGPTFFGLIFDRLAPEGSTGGSPPPA